MLVAFYFFAVNQKVLFPTPANLFMLWQIPFVAGTIAAIDPSKNSDLKWLGIVLSGNLFFVIGCVISSLHSKFCAKKDYEEFLRKPLYFDLHSGGFLIMLVLGVLSLVISLYFAVAVGYYVPLEAALTYADIGSLAASARTYSNLRTAVYYGGEKYLAPGYVAQFKNILLPLVVYLLYFRVIVLKRCLERVALAILSVVTILLLSLTGQRYPVVLFGVMFTLLVYWQNREKLAALSSKALLFLTIGLVALYYCVSTFLMARRITDYDIGVKSLFYPISELGRVLFSGARVQLNIALYLFQVYSSPVWGQNWIRGLADLLPGHRIGFSQELHQLVYGSLRGSVGLGLWGEIWLNFGWIGVLFVPLLLGMAMQRFTISFYRGKKTIIRTVVFIYAGWIISAFRSPVQLFSEGFVTLMLYYLLVNMVKHFENRRYPYRRDPEVHSLIMRS